MRESDRWNSRQGGERATDKTACREERERPINPETERRERERQSEQQAEESATDRTAESDEIEYAEYRCHSACSSARGMTSSERSSIIDQADERSEITMYVVMGRLLCIKSTIRIFTYHFTCLKLFRVKLNHLKTTYPV